MAKKHRAALMAAALIACLVALTGGEANAQTTPNAADLSRDYNAGQRLCTALPVVAANVAPTCQQAVALMTCLNNRAERAPASAGAALTCVAESHRVAQVARVARHVCAQQTDSLRAAIARAEGCESRSVTPNPPNPRPRRVSIPLCHEASGAITICVVTRGGTRTVYSGRAACSEHQSEISAAYCGGCPTGTILASESRFAATLNGIRERRGDACVWAGIDGRGSTAGIDLATFNRQVERIDDHQRRLDAFCRDEAACRDMREQIDRFRGITTAGGAYDDRALRERVDTLEQQMTQVRADTATNTAVLQRICQTNERPTVDNCRFAAGGDTTPPVGGRAPTVRFRPMAGGEIMLLTGQIQLTQVLLGARLSVAASDLIAFYISAGGTAGSYDATGVGSNVGYTIGAGMDFRFALAGMPAVVNLGFAHRGYNATGPRFANTVTEVGVFGDWLGSFYGAELGFSIGLYRGFGVGAHAVLGSGSGLVADQQGRFEVWSGFSYGGGLHLGYNF